MMLHKAQNVSARPRTDDIQISEDIDFKSMLLHQMILEGLQKSGYIKPSPIQKKALPLVRCGFDLIIQAKAGTGKTCVFTIAALELVKPNLPHLQAVILAPTREIALQVTDVINAIGQCVKGLKTCCFIGGFPLSVDLQNVVGCQIAVGAPGRMRHLLDKGLLNPRHVKLFVLDEADKLMEKSFLKDINEIFSQLPESKQVLACSATYSEELIGGLRCYMHGGQYVSPNQYNNPTMLLGMRQFVSVIPHHVDRLAQMKLKEKTLLNLLRSIVFNQCLIFSNLHTRAVSLCNLLRHRGWSVEWIAGRQEQTERVAALQQLREQRVRVLVTTDLTARGVDLEHVNLVINLDLPFDHQTYLHRMGRAGRYGSHGIVITVVSEGEEVVAFQKLIGAISGTSQSVNRITGSLKNIDLWSVADDQFDQICGIVIKKEDSATSEDSDERTTSTAEKHSPESSDNENSTRECVRKNGVEHLNDTVEYAENHLVESGDISENKISTASQKYEESTAGKMSKASDMSGDNFMDKLSTASNKSRESNVGKISITSDSSGDTTSSSEILSPESSETEEESVKKCNEKGPLPLEYTCVCDLYEPDASDIKVIAGPSLFAIKKQDHWSEVLPIVVNEYKIPLNTPIVLFDSKLIRIKFWDKNKTNHVNIGSEAPYKEIINFESKCDDKDFLRYVDIITALDKEVTISNQCESYVGNSSGELLSYENIEEALEKEVCEIGHGVGAKYNEIEKVLLKYKVLKERSENTLINFDSFDLVGWLAVDKLHNISEDIDIDRCEVFEFNLVSCLAGKNHIEIVSSPHGTCDDAHDDMEHITTLNVSKFNLKTPFSLANIAHQITQCKLTVCSETLKNSISSSKSFQEGGEKGIHSEELKEVHKCDIINNSENKNYKHSNMTKTKTTKPSLEMRSEVPIINSKKEKGNTRKNLVTRNSVNGHRKSRSLVSTASGPAHTNKRSNLLKDDNSLSSYNIDTSAKSKNVNRNGFIVQGKKYRNEQVNKLDGETKSPNTDDSSESIHDYSTGNNYQHHISKVRSDDSGSHIDMTQNVSKHMENLHTRNSDSGITVDRNSELTNNKSINAQTSLGAKSKQPCYYGMQNQVESEHNINYKNHHRRFYGSYDSYDTFGAETTDADDFQLKLLDENINKRKHHYPKHQESYSSSIKKSYDNHNYYNKPRINKQSVACHQPHRQEKHNIHDPKYKCSNNEYYNSHRESYDTCASIESEGTKPQEKLRSKNPLTREQKSKSKHQNELIQKSLKNDDYDSYKESYDGYSTIESEISKLKELYSKHQKEDKAHGKHHNEVRRKYLSKDSESKESLDDYDSADSEATNRHSFRTACSQHNNIEDHYIREYGTSNSSSRLSNYSCYKVPSEIPPHFHHNRHRVRKVSSKYSKAEQSDHYTNHRVQEPEDEILETQRYPQYEHSHSYENYDPSQFEFPQNSSNHNAFYTSHNTAGSTKIIKGNDLYGEWFLNWYTQVRQKAKEIELMEYINTMSSP